MLEKCLLESKAPGAMKTLYPPNIQTTPKAAEFCQTKETDKKHLFVTQPEVAVRNKITVYNSITAVHVGFVTADKSVYVTILF